MEKIFLKSYLLKATGGNNYEWKEVETVFEISQKGLFVIKIEASAKNALQNSSKDDDDLRFSLDDFDFGKYERHQESISWKGFGTSASWDGASLKNGTKIIYFFVELEVDLHTLKFFADETPTLKSIEIFKITNNIFELKNLKPIENIKNDHNGIPWLSFIFLGGQTKFFTLSVNTKSAKNKYAKDGDNLKVLVNGKIQKNPYTTDSNKYKNFYFSGDIREFDIFSILSDKLGESLAFENAIDLWYDEEPEIENLKIEYFDNEKFLEELKELVDLEEYVLDRAHEAISFFKVKKSRYSAQFLEHSLNENPKHLSFNYSDDLVKKIKKDLVYKKILNKLKEKIANGHVDGEIWPEEIDGGIVFNSKDLATSLHGIRKIEYNSKLINKNTYKIDFILFDVYDFQKVDMPSPFTQSFEYAKAIVNNAIDIGEDINVIKNFEIKIYITDII